MRHQSVRLESAAAPAPLRKGEMTRVAILDAALELSSRDGLEGLTIGLLAERMQMSKSGVFAHFGSREDLQVEVVREYHRRFEQEVFYPSLQEPRGLPRLWSMVRRWMEKRIQEVTTGASTSAVRSSTTIARKARCVTSSSRASRSGVPR
jgi:AcrR family transcriptional regulator